MAAADSDDAPTRIAVIGPNADRPQALFGAYSFINHVLPHHPDAETRLEAILGAAEKAGPSPVSRSGRPAASPIFRRHSFITSVPRAFRPAPAIVSS